MTENDENCEEILDSNSRKPDLDKSILAAMNVQELGRLILDSKQFSRSLSAEIRALIKKGGFDYVIKNRIKQVKKDERKKFLNKIKHFFKENILKISIGVVIGILVAVLTPKVITIINYDKTKLPESAQQSN